MNYHKKTFRKFFDFMPRNFSAPAKSNKNKELQCYNAKTKANKKSKKLIGNSNAYQKANFSYGIPSNRPFQYQQQIQSFPTTSYEYHQIHQNQQLIQLNRCQSRSTSNLLSKANQHQHQTFPSNLYQNSFQISNNSYISATPNSFFPPTPQQLIQNQPQKCNINTSMNIGLNQPLSPPRKISPSSQKQKRQKFTSEEDDIIIQLVGDNKFPNWNEIATHIKGRTGRQCRERYQHYLSPNLSCEPWTLQEDRIIFRLFKMYGSQWALIAQHFNGRRTNNSIKNRWYNHIRFFKDSLLNGEIKTIANSSIAKDSENSIGTFSPNVFGQLNMNQNGILSQANNNGAVNSNDNPINISNELNAQDSSDDAKFDDSDFQSLNDNIFYQQQIGQGSEQQVMIPLTTAPLTPEPRIPTYSFNNNNGSSYDQKGSINSSSSGLLPTICLKEKEDIDVKPQNSELQKVEGVSSNFTPFLPEQNQLGFSSPIYTKQNDKAEDKLGQNQYDDEKSKDFVDQFLCYTNNENSNDPYCIDFDFLMF